MCLYKLTIIGLCTIVHFIVVKKSPLAACLCNRVFTCKVGTHLNKQNETF